jgi:hypothetical protein
MGYRSTVAYSIRFIPETTTASIKEEDIEKAKKTFFTFIAEAKAKEETALCFTDNEHFKVDEENLAIYFLAEGVKWYDDYPDVKCHEALMDLSREWADDDDCSNPYIGGCLARVGDEMDDNVEEVWGQGDYDWCAIRRYVECDWID